MYSVIPFLGIYPKESKSAYSRDTFTFMFIATLFRLAKVRNQPVYSSIDE
jgi:hypothetical protein